MAMNDFPAPPPKGPQTSRYQLPNPPSLLDSLTAGTSLSPPPKKYASPPLETSNLSNQHHMSSSPATDLLPSPSLPGSFPTSPPPPSPLSETPTTTTFPRMDYITSTTASSSSPNPPTPPPTKRPSSVRKFLSFKSLNRVYNNNNTNSYSTDSLPSSPSSSRPNSPGGASVASSLRPSLLNYNSSNSTNNKEKKSRSSSSGTGFWARRKSSLNLLTLSGGNDVEDNNNSNNNSNSNSNRKMGQEGAAEDMRPSEAEHIRPRECNDNDEENKLPPRSTSPPPRLPELDQLGGGLGLGVRDGEKGGGGFLGGADLFKDIK